MAHSIHFIPLFYLANQFVNCVLHIIYIIWKRKNKCTFVALYVIKVQKTGSTKLPFELHNKNKFKEYQQWCTKFKLALSSLAWEEYRHNLLWIRTKKTQACSL